MTALVAAAQYERDRRAERYPAIIAAEPARADELTIDYQAWCAIAGWFETGQFSAIEAGGAAEDTVVGWALAEQAAEKALATINAKCDRLATGEEIIAGGNYAVACARRADLLCIHRAVQLRRQSIDTINADFRARGANHNQSEGIPA